MILRSAITIIHSFIFLFIYIYICFDWLCVCIYKHIRNLLTWNRFMHMRKNIKKLHLYPIRLGIVRVRESCWEVSWKFDGFVGERERERERDRERMGIEFCTGGCDNGNAYWWLFMAIPVRYVLSRFFLFHTTVFSLANDFFFSKTNDKRTNKIKQFVLRTLGYGTCCCSIWCSKII